MTKRDFLKIKRNIGKYEGKKVAYKAYVPQIEKYKMYEGTILECGEDVYKECFVIFYGYNIRHAIHYRHCKIIEN